MEWEVWNRNVPPSCLSFNYVLSFPQGSITRWIFGWEAHCVYLVKWDADYYRICHLSVQGVILTAETEMKVIDKIFVSAIVVEESLFQISAETGWCWISFNRSQILYWTSSVEFRKRCSLLSSVNCLMKFFRYYIKIDFSVVVLCNIENEQQFPETCWESFVFRHVNKNNFVSKGLNKSELHLLWLLHSRPSL